MPIGGLSYQVSEVAQRVKVFASKPYHLSLTPGTHKLSSDLHIGATYTPLTQQYTNVLKTIKPLTTTTTTKGVLRWVWGGQVCNLNY